MSDSPMDEWLDSLPSPSEVAALHALELRRARADAKLAVAEELGWLAAIGWAVVIHLKWDSWLLAIAAAGAIYWLLTRRYSKEHDAAWKGSGT